MICNEKAGYSERKIHLHDAIRGALRQDKGFNLEVPCIEERFLPL